MDRPFIVGNSVWITTVAFEQLFKGIEVRNYDTRYDGTVLKKICVEVSLDTKERIYHQLKIGGFKEMEQIDTRLPRISIEIGNITPRLKDYTGKEQKRMLEKNSPVIDTQPVPITITYEVGIWCKYFEHYAQILENILPWFDPYATVGVKERNLNIERQLKYKLVSVNNTSTFKMSENEQRVIKGELQFEADSFMYKAYKDTSTSSGIIETIQIPIVDITTPITSETIYISGARTI